MNALRSDEHKQTAAMNSHLILLLLQTRAVAYVVHGFSSLKLHQPRRPCNARTYTSSQTTSWGKCQTQGKSTALYSRTDRFEKLTIAGASVSSLGFLVVVNSTLDEHLQVAFPIQLTSCGIPPTVSNTRNEGESDIDLAIPSLFQENIDQTSVTTPEALTFLQLINDVDMATPILPPDTLSLICVLYAFLVEKDSEVEPGVYRIEDEMGLDSSNDADPDVFYPALEYIRSFVATMLPDSAGYSKSRNFLNLTEWQRAKVRLPNVRLDGVRVERVDGNTETSQQSGAEVNTMPLKFVLECTVDDDSKVLEVPLYAIPGSYDMSGQFNDALSLSEHVLQKFAHNFNAQTSASFIAMSLFHRYKRSKGAKLRVSRNLLRQMMDVQKNVKNERYCWVQTKNEVVSLSTIIRDTNLPSFKTLLDLRESDKRVLKYLEEQNFGASLTGQGTSARGSSASGSSKQSKMDLTVEQLVMQQKLKSAWKVATEKNDTKALSKIQKAMQDFEEQLELNGKDSNETSLQKIKRAMRENRSDEENCGLITDLENSIDDNEFS